MSRPGFAPGQRLWVRALCLLCPSDTILLFLTLLGEGSFGFSGAPVPSCDPAVGTALGSAGPLGKVT